MRMDFQAACSHGLARRATRQPSGCPTTRNPLSQRLRLQRQAMKTVLYAVDRLDRNVAVLVSDRGETIEMPRLELPSGIHEGSVLRVRFGAQNLPDWSSAVIDREEETRRLKEAKQQLDEMKRSDPGADIKV